MTNQERLVKWADGWPNSDYPVTISATRRRGGDWQGNVRIPVGALEIIVTADGWTLDDLFARLIDALAGANEIVP